MAVKKDWNDGKPKSWEDAYDTQEALDAGILNSVRSGTTEWEQNDTGFFGIGGGKSSGTMQNWEGKAGFGSSFTIDGMDGNTGIAAFRGRKDEQKKTKAQGNGLSQSILGGTVV